MNHDQGAMSKDLSLPAEDQNLNNVPFHELNFVLPGGVTLHKTSCVFHIWNTIHRNSVLKTEDVKNYFATFTINVKGEKYYAQNMDRVNQSAECAAVQKYLAGSMSTFESFKPTLLRMCKCSVVVFPNEKVSQGNNDEEKQNEALRQIETSLFGRVLSDSDEAILDLDAM